MAIKLQEGAIKAVHRRLDDTLNTYVDEVNAQHDDGFSIDYPAQILTFVPPIDYLTQFPTVAIKDGPFHLQDDTGWGATGVSILHIIVFETDPDQERLAWKLRRHAQAVTRCVLKDRRFEPGEDGWAVELQRVDPGPTLGSDEPQTFMSMVAVTIEVRTEQDTP